MRKKNEELIMENAVSVVEDKSVSTEVRSWGATEDMDASDILIPKIYHQQSTSKFVSDGLAKPGDFCDSLTGEVLAGKDTPLNVIVFAFNKKMLISEQVGTNKAELKRIEEVTPENVNLPWREELPGGVTLVRQKQYNYFVLPTSKIDDLPLVISFQSTKIKTGMAWNALMQKLRKQNLPSYAVVFSLESVKTTNDKGTWYGINIKQSGKTVPEEQDIAYEWEQRIKGGNIQVAEDIED